MLKYNNNYIKQIITSYDINIWKSFIESTKKDNIFLIFFPFLNILGKYTIGYHYNLPKISDEQRNKLKEVALKDVGEGYDWLSCIGKFLTWLTGIILFARYVQLPQKEICINRVAYWLREATEETFGAKTSTELTTHTMYKYIKRHPELFDIIYEGVPNES